MLNYFLKFKSPPFKGLKISFPKNKAYFTPHDLNINFILYQFMPDQFLQIKNDCLIQPNGAQSFSFLNVSSSRQKKNT